MTKQYVHVTNSDFLHHFLYGTCSSTAIHNCICIFISRKTWIMEHMKPIWNCVNPNSPTHPYTWKQAWNFGSSLSVKHKFDDVLGFLTPFDLRFFINVWMSNIYNQLLMQNKRPLSLRIQNYATTDTIELEALERCLKFWVIFSLKLNVEISSFISYDLKGFWIELFLFLEGSLVLKLISEFFMGSKSSLVNLRIWASLILSLTTYSSLIEIPHINFGY